VGCLLPIAGGEQKKKTKHFKRYASSLEKPMLMRKGADKKEKTKKEGKK
jgi:hypothetical protein